MSHLQLVCSLPSDIFDEAQQFVYAKMEELIWDRFLRSEDGQNYLEILVARDIQRKQRRYAKKMEMISVFMVGVVFVLENRLMVLLVKTSPLLSRHLTRDTAVQNIM